MGLIPDIDETVDKALKVLDTNILSRQEIEANRTERLQMDLTSPYKLPHLIRPILALWSAGLHTILSIWALAIGADPLIIIGGSATIMIAVIGFYFNSRKAEKIQAKRMIAAIEINKDQNDMEIERDEIELELHSKREELIIKEEKRSNRISRREQRKANRRTK